MLKFLLLVAFFVLVIVVVVHNIENGCFVHQCVRVVR